VFVDAIGATGSLADGPVDVVGASVGGMIAAELAALRPEVVARLALLAPFGIADEQNIGLAREATPSAERLGDLFAKGVPEQVANRFARYGDEEAPVATYLADIAAASLIWPLGDRGLRKRVHRRTCAKLLLWGRHDDSI